MQGPIWNEISKKSLEVMNSTGYPIIFKKNGQRIFGPPSDWIGPPPPRGCEVFVGKLPLNIYENELMPIFLRVGKIYMLRLMMDFSGSNKGYAFVCYATRAEASAAIEQLHNYEIRPRRHIRVVESVDNCRLFIGNIPKHVTKAEVLKELSDRVTGIVQVIMYENYFYRNLNRGYAFVEFVSHRAAALARRVLALECFRICNRDITVDWAKPEPEVDDDQKEQHLDNMKKANSLKDEEIGSSYAPDCLSPIQNVQYQQDVLTAPASLDSLCNRYTWTQPHYNFQPHFDAMGNENWVCLFHPPVLGPLYSSPCLTCTQAQHEQQQDLVHPIGGRPVYQPMVPAAQPYIQPWEYVCPTFYPAPPLNVPVPPTC